jgi:hypothetical protein
MEGFKWAGDTIARRGSSRFRRQFLSTTSYAGVVVSTEPFEFDLRSVFRLRNEPKPPRWFVVLQTVEPLVFAAVGAVGLLNGSFGHSSWVGYLALILGVTNFSLSCSNLWLGREDWKTAERLARPTRLQWVWATFGWGLTVVLLVLVIL